MACIEHHFPIQTKSVPRETADKLHSYLNLLLRWQKSINLVGKATLEEAWDRHILDSLQLLTWISKKDSIVDVGTGAGFPGLALNIAGCDQVDLVESDQRKAAFLKEAVRITGATAKIKNQRAETLDFSLYDIITCRAFASLPELLALLQPTLKSTHKLMLLKGSNFQKELDEARLSWSFIYEVHESCTEKAAAILILTHIHKRIAP